MVKKISLLVDRAVFGDCCLVQFLPSILGVAEGLGCELDDDLLVVAQVLCERSPHLNNLLVFLLL